MRAMGPTPPLTLQLWGREESSQHSGPGELGVSAGYVNSILWSALLSQDPPEGGDCVLPRARPQNGGPRSTWPMFREAQGQVFDLMVMLWEIPTAQLRAEPWRRREDSSMEEADATRGERAGSALLLEVVCASEGGGRDPSLLGGRIWKV